MADAGIKKVTIAGSTLPPIIVTNATDVGKYYLKFRVVSEDRSKRSAYSPVTIIDGVDVSGNDVKCQYYSDEQSFRINWTVPDIVKQTTYDVYVKWFDGATPPSTWTYHSTVTSAQATLKIPATNKANVQIMVQTETDPHIVNAPAKIFQTGSLSTSQTNITVTNIDGGGVA
jgi:hypothetical protein